MNETVIKWAASSAALPFLIAAMYYVRYTDRRLQARAYLMGVAFNGILGLGCVLRGEHLGAALNAALTAWHLYNWWNNGGGDGLRRLLKKIRTFGAGRLAPQPS